jgi:protein SCO1/2
MAAGPRSLYASPGGAAPWLFGGWALVLALWLAFAFAPAQGSLAWVRTAQAACFGTLDNGLPSAWGWAVLVLAPGSMLAGLLAAYGGELREWLKAGRKGGGTWLAGLALASLLALALGWAAHRVLQAQTAVRLALADPADEPLPELYPVTALPLPDFKLTDQRGEAVGPGSLRGRPTLLTFAYAHCATVCPFLVRDTLRAAKAVPGSRAVFLTLDPWRDTPGSLPSLARRFGLGEESRLLSGDPAQVQALLSGLKVETRRDELTGEIDHPPLVYVLDAQGRIAYRFNRPPERWLSDALRRLQKA